MSAKDVLKLIKDEEVEYVDVRFTDPKGKLQHVTLIVDIIDEDFFEEGFMSLERVPRRAWSSLS